MPYYQCPKCGGRDTYQGTELVSGNKGGGAIIGPENDLGFSPVVGVGGKTTVDEQTVVKCKTCDINLGQKDIRYSKEELEKIEAAKKWMFDSFSESLPLWAAGLSLIIIGIIIIALQS